MYRNCLYLLNCSLNVINKNKLETSFIKRWAGHSKWQNIKATKEAADAVKAKYITVLSRKLPAAIRDGGGSADPDKNLMVKALLNDAKANNIPKESIEKIIKRAIGTKDGKPNYLCVRGPKNLLFTVEVVTHSISKTKFDLVAIAKKFNFQVEVPRDNNLEFFEKGVVKCKPLDSKSGSLDKALEHAIEANAEEVTEDEDKNLVFECSSNNIDQVKDKLEALGYSVDFADSVIKFSERIELSDAEIEVCEKFVKKVNAVSEVMKISDNIV